MYHMCMRSLHKKGRYIFERHTACDLGCQMQQQSALGKGSRHPKPGTLHPVRGMVIKGTKQAQSHSVKHGLNGLAPPAPVSMHALWLQRAATASCHQDGDGHCHSSPGDSIAGMLVSEHTRQPFWPLSLLLLFQSWPCTNHPSHPYFFSSHDRTQITPLTPTSCPLMTIHKSLLSPILLVHNDHT